MGPGDLEVLRDAVIRESAVAELGYQIGCVEIPGVAVAFFVG